MLLGTLQLDQTYVPIPFAYDAMKHAYMGKETQCAMMVSVDFLGQCPQSNYTNNFAVFPVKVSVNETRGKFNCMAYLNTCAFNTK